MRAPDRAVHEGDGRRPAAAVATESDTATKERFVEVFQKVTSRG